MADVLRHREFRYLAIGVTMSRVGDAMSFVVIAWLALSIGGPAAVGMVVFAGGVVTALGAPVIGYLLDVLGLRRLMLLDNLIRGLLMVALAGLVHTGGARLWHLLVFAVLSALLAPATEIGHSVAVPVLLKSRELDAANRLLSASWDIAAWIGPAVAGFGIEIIGSPSVLLIDAATFFVMALVALVMPGRLEHDDGADAGRPSTTIGRLLGGFAILWRLRPAAVLTLIGVAHLFLGGMYEVFLPAFNKITLEESAATYGLLVSISGGASLLGTLALTPLLTRLGYGPALVLVLAVRGLAALPLAFIGSWGLAAFFVALAAMPDGSYYPLARTVGQRIIPPSVRGRVQGAGAALGVAGWPLGAAVGGLLMATTGPPATAVVMALGYLPLAVLILLTPALRRHAVPDEPPEASVREEALVTSSPSTHHFSE
jgi:MFS family permease